MKFPLMILLLVTISGCTTSAYQAEREELRNRKRIQYFTISGKAFDVPLDTIRQQSDSCSRLPFLRQNQPPKYFNYAVASTVSDDSRLEGDVYVKLWVNTKGRVRYCEVVKSDSDLLDKCSLEAVKQWTFSPYIVDCRSQEFTVEVSFSFRYNRGNLQVFAP